MKNREIILRTPTPEDTDTLYLWENNIEIWHLSNNISPYTREDIRRHIDECSKSIYETGQARYMICLAENGRPLGTIDLFDFDPDNMRAGIGILIAERSDRRRGYATMALDALLSYCFGHLGLHHVYCNISPDNQPSIILFTAAGFKQSTGKYDRVKTGDVYKDELFFELFSPGDR